MSDLPAFRDHLAVQVGLAPWVAFGVAAFLPWLELICGLCLVTGRAVREAAVLTAILLVLFLAADLVQPAASDCGCMVWPARWSPSAGRLWFWVRDLALLACAARTMLRP